MSLVNAVHELIEVAAGRRNLSGVAADELHAAIDAEQAPAASEPEAEAAPTAEELAEFRAWQANQHVPAAPEPPVYEVPASPAQATAGVPWPS